MFKKTVDSIVKDFTKVVQNLSNLTDELNTENNISRGIIETATKSIEQNEIEIKRAQRIKDKLNIFINFI